MTSDFNTLIRNAMANGATAEDIAEQVGSILNEIEANKSKVNKRQAAVDSIEETFHKNYASKHLSISDVAALALLVVEKDYPDWTPEDINDFMASVDENVRIIAKMIKGNPLENIGELLSALKDETKGRLVGCLKLGGTDRKCEDKCSCEKSNVKSDIERIKEFLNSL